MEALYFETDVYESEEEDRYIDGRLVVDIYVLKHVTKNCKIYKTKALVTKDPKIVELLNNEKRTKRYLKKPMWFYSYKKAFGYTKHIISKEVKKTKKLLERLLLVQKMQPEVIKVNNLCDHDIKTEGLEDTTPSWKYLNTK